MKVRAKFRVVSVETYENDYQKIKLTAHYGKEGDNIDFTPYTPAGEITISVTDKSAAGDVLLPGKVCWVDFEVID